MSEPFIGEIRMFAGNFAPRGWAFCDGQLLAPTQNQALFALLGTIYGGDGRSTFALPDLRGRVPIHEGRGPGLNDRRLGERGGQEHVVLSPAQLPAHTHALAASSAPADRGQPEGSRLAKPDKNLYRAGGELAAMAPEALPASVGGGFDHDNIQPYLALNFIIALLGIFPSRT